MLLSDFFKTLRRASGHGFLPPRGRKSGPEDLRATDFLGRREIDAFLKISISRADKPGKGNSTCQSR
jgi:hypothetical protein